MASTDGGNHADGAAAPDDDYERRTLGEEVRVVRRVEPVVVRNGGSSEDSDGDGEDDGSYSDSGSSHSRESLQSSISSNGSNAFAVGDLADGDDRDPGDDRDAADFNAWSQENQRLRIARRTRRAQLTTREQQKRNRERLAKRAEMAEAGTLAPHPDSLDPSTGRHYQHTHLGASNLHGDFHTVLSVHPPVVEAPRFSRLAAEVCARLESSQSSGKTDMSLRNFERVLAKGRTASGETTVASQRISELADTVSGEGDVHDRLTRSLLWPLTQAPA